METRQSVWFNRHGTRRHERWGSPRDPMGPLVFGLILLMMAGSIVLGIADDIAERVGMGGTCTGLLILFVVLGAGISSVRAMWPGEELGCLLQMVMIAIGVSAMPLGARFGVSPWSVFGWLWSSVLATLLVTKLALAARRNPRPLRAAFQRISRDYRNWWGAMVLLACGSAVEILAKWVGSSPGNVLKALGELTGLSLASVFLYGSAAERLTRWHPSTAALSSWKERLYQVRPWVLSPGVAAAASLLDLVAWSDPLELSHRGLVSAVTVASTAALCAAGFQYEAVTTRYRVARTIFAAAVVGAPTVLPSLSLLALSLVPVFRGAGTKSRQ
jgi:hypothetical protein